METSTRDLTKYLEQVSKLEASVYKQEQCYSTAKSNLVYEKPKKTPIEQPVKKDIKKPVKFSHNPFGKFLAVLGILSVLVGPTAFITDFPIALGIVLIVIGLILCGLAFYLVKEDRKGDQIYENKLAQYNDDVKKAEEDYQRKMEQYQRKMTEANAAYQKKCEETKQAYNYANQSVEQMVEPLNETKAILQKYYDLDIIFPKYRSLAAMSTMCEYFQTGRCSELTGPNGAYNLYESELRQNLIINQLDAVIGQLEQIKNNQYLLYTELRQVREATEYIAGTTTALLDSSKRIEANTAVTAYCAEITAANTTALTMMAAFG